MRIFRGFNHTALAANCALTIGNFDGVHRGHQAMLALLQNEAMHRKLPSTVLTFEPHPRDYFAHQLGKPNIAPKRIATLRDKLQELRRCGIDQVIVMPFNEGIANLAPETFINDILVAGMGAKYVLVGDDFRFGAQRGGDYQFLDRAGLRYGFDVARMLSYEVHGLRVSSSAVREALAKGNLDQAARLMGRPYAISGHVIHGQKLGRRLGLDVAGIPNGFRTLNIRFPHPRPALTGIFAARIHGLIATPVLGVASLGTRPTVEQSGRVLLETYCFEWPRQLDVEAGYGKLIQVELLQKLRDEAHFDNLEALTAAISRDVKDAQSYFSQLQ